MKKTIITSIGFLLLTTHAFALDPLGPPVATSNKDQFTASLEYLYSEMNLHADSLNLSTPFGNLQFPSAEFKDIEMNKFYINILSILGSNNNDFFLRLGLTDVSPDKNKNQDNLAGSIGNSDSGFTFGGGFRTTLFQSDKIKWGLLTQFSFAQLDFDDKTYLINGSDVLISKTTLDMFDIQIAAGPTYQFTDEFFIYGGPFLHFVNGNVELRGKVKVDDINIDIEDSTKLEQQSELGGFLGLSTDLSKNTKFNIEFQLTDDAQAVGFRFIHRF